MTRPLRGLLVAGALLLCAPALADAPRAAPSQTEVEVATADHPRASAREQAPADAGSPKHAKLSAEDEEVVQNLELLENLDQAAAMDVLTELSDD